MKREKSFRTAPAAADVHFMGQKGNRFYFLLGLTVQTPGRKEEEEEESSSRS